MPLVTKLADHFITTQVGLQVVKEERVEEVADEAWTAFTCGHFINMRLSIK